MIPIDFRSHVIDWKKTFHLFPERGLFENEWLIIKQIPKQNKFHQGEEIEDKKFFKSYSRHAKNGMDLTTKEKIENISLNKAKYYIQRREQILKIRSMYYKKNKTKIDKIHSEYRKINKKKHNEQTSRWAKKNKDKLRIYYKKIYQNKRKNPQKIIIELLRCRIRYASKRGGLYKRIYDLPSVRFLMWLAEYQNIKNIKGYDIDHLIPLSKCNISTPEGQKISNSPENVRWMKHIDNIKKSNNMPSQSEIDAHLALVALWRASKCISAQ